MAADGSFQRLQLQLAEREAAVEMLRGEMSSASGDRDQLKRQLADAEAKASRSRGACWGLGKAGIGCPLEPSAPDKLPVQGCMPLPAGAALPL